MTEGDIILFYHTARASMPSVADKDPWHPRLAKGCGAANYLTAKWAVFTSSVKNMMSESTVRPLPASLAIWSLLLLNWSMALWSSEFKSQLGTDFKAVSYCAWEKGLVLKGKVVKGLWDSLAVYLVLVFWGERASNNFSFKVTALEVKVLIHALTASSALSLLWWPAECWLLAPPVLHLFPLHFLRSLEI